MTRESGTSRRAFLGAAGTAVLWGTGRAAEEAAVGGPRTSHGWRQFHRGPANLGHNPSATVPATAEEQFRVADIGVVYASSTVAAGTVYVGTRGGLLLALAAGDGTERWRVGLGAPVNSSPAVVDGTVYVGSNDATLHALDAATGDRRFQFDSAGGQYWSSPTIVDGTVYVGNDDGRVYAVDAATGTERWAFVAGEQVRSTPAVVGDAVYIGSDAGVHALDGATGTERWHAAVGGTPGAPAVATVGGTRTVVVGHWSGTLAAYRADDGTVLWEFKTDAGVWSSPAVADGAAFVGGLDGNVYAVDAATGTERWATPTGGKVYSSPAVADDAVVVGSDGGSLFALDAASGAVRWSLPLGAAVSASPAVVDGTVLAGSDAGVHAVRAPNEPPDAAFTYEPATPEAGEQVTFDASGTTDDGTVAGYEWRFRSDGPFAATGQRVTHTYEESGNYEVTLRVVDDDGATNRRSRTVTVAERSTTTDGGGAADPEDGGTTADGAGGAGILPWAAGAAGAVLAGAGASWHLRSRGTDDGGDAAPTGDDGGSGPTTPAGGGPGRDRVTETLDAAVEGGGPPDSIPAEPPLEVAYDDLRDLEHIGGGGNADVYRAVQPTDDVDRVLALKEPRLEGTVDATIVEQFESEADTWSKLDDHEGVVGLFDWGVEPAPWIAMELMEGGHLGARVGDLSLVEAAWVGARVADAVHHAHRLGVAHLDLKPANILFRSVEGAWDVPKVGDWGLSQLLLEHSGSIDQYSPKYAAPEQFDHDTYGDVDDRTDVYQLGVVLYELFTGVAPFKGDPSRVMHAVLEDEMPTPSAENPDVPPAVDGIVTRAMARHKEDRYETVVNLRKDLEALLPENL